MTQIRLALAMTALIAFASPVVAQQCTTGAPLTADQQARRKQGVQITRTVNNLEANQPGSNTKSYLRQVELAKSEFAGRVSGPSAAFIKSLNFAPGAEVMPGWQLTLDVTPEGYWFMLKDTTDPCGFAYLSNQNGVIYEAQPIR